MNKIKEKMWGGERVKERVIYYFAPASYQRVSKKEKKKSLGGVPGGNRTIEKNTRKRRQCVVEFRRFQEKGRKAQANPRSFR